MNELPELQSRALKLIPGIVSRLGGGEVTRDRQIDALTYVHNAINTGDEQGKVMWSLMASYLLARLGPQGSKAPEHFAQDFETFVRGDVDLAFAPRIGFIALTQDADSDKKIIKFSAENGGAYCTCLTALDAFTERYGETGARMGKSLAMLFDDKVRAVPLFVDQMRRQNVNPLKERRVLEIGSRGTTRQSLGGTGILDMFGEYKEAGSEDAIVRPESMQIIKVGNEGDFFPKGQWSDVWTANIMTSYAVGDGIDAHRHISDLFVVAANAAAPGANIIHVCGQDPPVRRGVPGNQGMPMVLEKPELHALTGVTFHPAPPCDDIATTWQYKKTEAKDVSKVQFDAWYDGQGRSMWRTVRGEGPGAQTGM